MILDLFRLDGKVAIVTGAGRGIGAASALALAECGADVVIASRTQSDLDHVADLVAKTGRRAVSVAGDLADLEIVRSLVSAAKNGFGRLDVVVNNAGGAIPLPFFDTTPEYLEEAFHFNVTTAHALNLAAVPLILEQGGGSIINVSSVMGRVLVGATPPTGPSRLRFLITRDSSQRTWHLEFASTRLLPDLLLRRHSRL